MSDEVEAQEVADVVEEAPTGLTHEQALAELAKVRREAAKHRTEKQSTKAALEELQRYKDAEKTELERATERALKAEEKLTLLAKENMARAAAKEAGLDPELSEFLKGSTEEELLESAKALAARMGTPAAPANPDLFAGSRGTPVRSAADSNKDAFRKLFG